MKAIYLDMDGVLVDFVGGCLDLFGVAGTELDGKPIYDCVNGWDMMPKVISRALGKEVSDAEFWQIVGQAGEYFWANLDWTPKGKEILQLCEHYAPVVLMSAPTNHPSSAAGKMRWIKTNAPTIWKTRRWALTAVKHHFAHPGAILVDDGTHNHRDFKLHGGDCYLVPAPWNCEDFSTRDLVAELTQFLTAHRGHLDLESD